MREIGNSLRQMRLNNNQTQQQLAEAAGIDRATLSQLENGRPGTFLTVVQVLRALQQLDVFTHWERRATINPRALARLERKQRRRASPAVPPPPPPPSEW